MPSKVVCKIDHRLAQWRIDFVGTAVCDIGAVEFELIERQLLDFGQRRIGSTEIIQRQPYIVRLEFLAELAGERKVGDDLLLRNIDNESGPFFACRAMSLNDLVDGN